MLQYGILVDYHGLSLQNGKIFLSIRIFSNYLDIEIDNS